MARQPDPSHGDSSHKLLNRNNEDMLMSDDESEAQILKILMVEEQASIKMMRKTAFSVLMT